MTIPISLNGPRLVQPGERSASHWLSQVCFSDEPPLDQPALDVVDGAAVVEPEEGETYAFFDGKRPVSQISLFFLNLRIHGCPVRIGSIGGVCTHPDYRGQRLAGILLEYCAERLVQGGARLMIVSGGRGLYVRAGCVPMGKFMDLTFGPDSQAGLPISIKLRRATPDDAVTCSRLYQSEQVHFVRSKRSFQEHFQSNPQGFPAENLIVEVDGIPAAYLLLHVPWDYVGQPDARVRRIFEYAGSRLAIACALPRAVAEFGFHELQAPVPWQDIDIWTLLPSSQMRPACTGLPEHTLRILDFPGLMADLRGFQAALLSDDVRRFLCCEQHGSILASGGDRHTLRLGKDAISLDGAAMTRLVFGSDDAQPLPASIGALAEIIDALFPLPAFFTGLDYH